jgi:hypothetical protein
MNAIQQEAIAKAAGLTKDELAQSLMDREALANLSAEEGESAQQAFNRLVQEVGMEEAKKQLGDETLANQYEQQSVQERFAQTVEKVKETFVQIAEPIMAILSPLMDIVGSVLPMVNVLLQPIVFAFQTIGSTVSTIFTWLSESKGLLVTLGSLATGLYVAMNGAAIAAGAIATQKKLIKMYDERSLIIDKGKQVIDAVRLGYQTAMGSLAAREALMQKKGLALSIGKAAMNAIASLSAIPIVGWALGLAAAGTVAALGYKYMNDGIVSPSSGGGGYGDRVLYGPEGAISFNNKDTIVAGTDLFSKGDDVMSGPKGAISVSNKTSPKKEVKQDSNAGTNARLDALIAMTGKVNAVSTLKIQ